MKIGFAQINPTVGDLAGNRHRIEEAYHQLVARGAEIILTPELAIPGYPPQDLLFQSRFVPRNLEALNALAAITDDVPLVVGFADFHTGTGKPMLNSAAVLQFGRIASKVSKSRLPTYDVFDEDRYFEPAHQTHPVEIRGHRVGITLCEDIWTEPFLPRPLYGPAPVESLIEQGATLLLNLSASPFTLGKPKRRLQMLGELAREHQIPIAYCNCTGANDQLIFDGNSLLLGADGLPRLIGPAFEEGLLLADTEAPPLPPYQFPADEESLFHALRLGIRDYLQKCGFRSAVIGLSGGIDSAVVAALAVAALGPENVVGVTMPTQFSSSGSVSDSEALARALGIRLLNIPIQAAFESFRSQFGELFAGLPENETEENMQPRLRGMTLMALSNKFGHLVLSTGNKSELAVGYCTLYGDMCGGLAVISDVPKTRVYELARWINRHREIIPLNTLDPILELLVEHQLSFEEIVTHGFEEETVRWVLRRVALNEYKRAQAAPGLKITPRAFGVGRKMPIAQRYQDF
jgi:NAD+ synthetase